MFTGIVQIGLRIAVALAVPQSSRIIKSDRDATIILGRAE